MEYLSNKSDSRFHMTPINGEINCNQQSADLDGEANLCAKLQDLCFNDFYWCFVVLLFIIVKYFGRCSNEEPSVKSARLMRF